MIDHLADLESDFSAIHRVDDIYALDGPRFFRLAWRIAAYEGVMRMRVEEQAQQEVQPTPVPPRAVSPPPAQPPVRSEALAVTALQHPDLIERVVVS